MVLNTGAMSSFKLAVNQVKDASKNVPVFQSKKVPQIAQVPPIKKFICGLCGFKFSKEIFLTNHYKFCKDIDNPADRIGAGNVTVQEENSNVEVQSKECPGNDSPSDLIFDIKDEEVEFTETIMFPEVTPICPLPEKPIKNLTTDMEDELFRRNTRKMMMTRLNTSVNHETEASGELPKIRQFVCNLCGFRFSKERYLENHYNLCKDVKNSTDRLGMNASIVKKELCEGEVWTTDVLDKNMKTEPMSDMNADLDVESIKPSTMETPVKLRQPQRKPFKCTTCDFSTSQSRIFRKHIKTHTEIKPFKCAICEFSTAWSQCLRLHMSNHTGVKPFKCTICEYSTARSGHLRYHLMMHTGEKPFKCTICDFSTVQSDKLKIHMRTHTGEKPFKCTICEHSTAQSGQIKIHMRKHTGEKPFKCTICEFSAAWPQCLILHMSSHTGIKPFKCTFCDYSTALSGSLKRHILIHSGNK